METGIKSESIYCTNIYKGIIIISSIVALILIIISLFAVKTTMQKKEMLKSNGVSTTAEIIGFDWETTVDSEKTVISFSDRSGGVHTMPLGFYSSDMYVGIEVPIIYDSAHTNTIMYTGDNSFFINYGAGILLSIGALIMGIIAVTTFIGLIRLKRSGQLCFTGSAALADFASLETKIDFGRSEIFVLKCSYTHSDKKEQLMSSQYLRYDPTPFLEGKKVKFYFDPDNHSNYFIDVQNSIKSE